MTTLDDYGVDRAIAEFRDEFGSDSLVEVEAEHDPLRPSLPLVENRRRLAEVRESLFGEAA